MINAINVTISKKEVTKLESAKILLDVSNRPEAIELDIDATSLLATTRVVPEFGEDFLLIAAVVYAADKAISRRAADDQWTREISVTIPVHRAKEWNKVSAELSACVGFLTGDVWDITFSSDDAGFIRKKTRKRKLRVAAPDVSAVCLLSGGLDSFIGALDWLTAHPDSRLLCVGHYDRDVAGPGKDQRTLIEILNAKFPGRLDFAQARVGMLMKGEDINFRSRSLLFLALGMYFADTIATTVPVWIPENGPIALNFPLTPSRRGSCSTRTVHPDFIHRINAVLKRAGCRHRIDNPYALKTKGEMVKQCLDQKTLNSAHPATRSCAKANRRMHWNNRAARGCGVCIPCLFRRASLHVTGEDSERYGIMVESISRLEGASADVLAMCAFLRRDLSSRELARGLLANGSLPLNQLEEYVALIKRMRSEVATWLNAKASLFLKELAGI